MRTALGTVAGVLTLWGGAAAAGCNFGVTSEPAWVSTGLNVISQVADIDKETLIENPGDISVSVVDLDQDGTDELCIDASTMMTCSQGVVVCLHIIWSVAEDRVLLETATHQLGFAKGEAGGFSNVRSEWSSPNGYVYEEIFAMAEGGYASQAVNEIGYWGETVIDDPVDANETGQD